MMTIRIRSDLLAVHSRLKHSQEWDRERNKLETVINRYLKTQSGENVLRSCEVNAKHAEMRSQQKAITTDVTLIRNS
jgi:hypothetical protein